MKKEDVPQDQMKAFEGQTKPIYVLNENGEYITEQTSGWEAEEVVLNQAIAQFETPSKDARRRVEQGLSAPLEYHMYQCRMDLSVLAQSTGFFQWQIKRHMRPAIFSRLSNKKLAKYQEALGLSLEALQTLPAEEATNQP